MTSPGGTGSQGFLVGQWSYAGIWVTV